MVWGRRYVPRLEEREALADDFCHGGGKIGERTGFYGDFGIELQNDLREIRRAGIYSGESVWDSSAFKSNTVTVRPSILRIPSDCRRERLRETNSRTVPICEATS